MASDSPEEQSQYSILVSSDLVGPHIEVRIPRDDGDIAVMIPQRGVESARLADAAYVRDEIRSVLEAITNPGCHDSVSTSGTDTEPRSLLTLEIPREKGLAKALIYRHMPYRQLCKPHERLNAVAASAAVIRNIVDSSSALRIQRYPVLQRPNTAG